MNRTHNSRLCWRLGSSEQADDGGGHVAREQAAEHCTQTEGGEVCATFRGERADAADLNGDRGEVCKAAECVAGEGKTAGLDGTSLGQARKVQIADEFVEDNAAAEHLADGLAVGGRDADQPREWCINPA